MSYDDYVRHIAQKYRLAISISVIQTKPENVSLENYIEQLRNKLNEDTMDPEELNISLRSDDFHIDGTDNFGINTIVDNNDVDTDATNLQSNEKEKGEYAESINAQGLCDSNDMFPQNNGKIHRNQLFNDENMYLNNDKTNVEIINTQSLGVSDDNIDQSKIRNQQPSNDENEEINLQDETNVDMIDTQDLNDSITILRNFDDANDDLRQRSSLRDVMEILRCIDDNAKTAENVVSNKNLSQSTHCDSLQQNPDQVDIVHCFTDNDVILCESADILSNADKDELSQKHNNSFMGDNQILNQKKGQTEQKTDLPTKFKVDFKETQTSRDRNQYPTTNNKGVKECKNNIEAITKCEKKLNNVDLNNRLKISEAIPQTTIRNYRHTKELKNIYQNVADIFDTKRNEAVNDKKVHNINNIVESDNLKDTLKDSQNTIFQTLPEDFTCNTHYSESQVQDLIVIEDKYIYGTNKNKKKLITEENVGDRKKFKHNENDVFSQEIQLAQTTTSDYMYENKTNKDTNAVKDINECTGKEKCTKRKATYIDNDIFSQESQLNILTPSNKSNYNNEKFSTETNRTLMNIEDSNDFTNDMKNDPSNAKYDVLFSQESQLDNFASFSQNAQRIDEYFVSNRIQKSDSMAIGNVTEYNIISLNKSCAVFDKNPKNISLTEQIGKRREFDENLENIHVSDEVAIIKDDSNIENLRAIELNSCANFDSMQVAIEDYSQSCPNFDSMQVQEVSKPFPTDKQCDKALEEDQSCNNFENIDLEEWTDSQRECIPFKVIEELNKVKMYLNGRNDRKLSADGYFSDAGYKSDSQSKNSYKMSQSSTGWLDQAAHCLFRYITECPLVVTTQDITDEVSEVLGQLVDKLQDEEKYPTFLEALLDTVQLLLGIVYEENTGEDVLIKKDESIHRILLLNKSIHIQKYTIEKITSLLNNLYGELTSKDSTYESKNIDQIENTCYIFHILEIILQKYNKSSQNLSQNTQSSQEEERALKKSDIVDIWRKKWNPSYKDLVKEGSQEKQCVVDTCSDVLNKLIVGCMDGYSLISYFALKCFNAMQT